MITRRQNTALLAALIALVLGSAYLIVERNNAEMAAHGGPFLQDSSIRRAHSAYWRSALGQSRGRSGDYEMPPGRMLFGPNLPRTRSIARARPRSRSVSAVNMPS